MIKKILLSAVIAITGALTNSGIANAQMMDEQSQATFDTVMKFMGAMGGGEMETLTSLMADDMVWQNGGDKSMPWIGPWEGKEAVLGFLGVFMSNVETILWEAEDSIASGDTFAQFGNMRLRLTNSGEETEVFTYGLRAKVSNGQIVLWNWLEDSFAVSEAYHGNSGGYGSN